MSSIYSSAPQRPRVGLNRGYNNRLHLNFQKPDAPRKRLDIQPIEENPIDAPPESSGEDDNKISENESDGSPPSPVRTKARFASVRAPKRGHSWSKQEESEQQKRKAQEDNVMGFNRPKPKRKFGTAKSRHNNIHTSNELFSDEEGMPAKAKVFKEPIGAAELSEQNLRSVSANSAWRTPTVEARLPAKSKKAEPLRFRTPTVAHQEEKPGTKPEFIQPRGRVDTPKGRTTRSTKGRKAKSTISRGAGRKATLKPTPDVAAAASRVDPSLPRKIAAFHVPPAATTPTSGSSSPLSSPLSSQASAHSFDLEPYSSMTTTFTPLSPSSAQSPTCPMCSEAVVGRLLKDFKEENLPPGKTQLSVRQQLVFCKQHKRLDAETTWKERNYPDIDWSLLPARIEVLREHLAAIIEGSTSSFYRERARKIHEEQPREKRRLNIQRELDEHGDGAELLGYYGGKGGRIIGDWIGGNLARNLNDVNGTDEDLRKLGSVSAFVQAVLVPEAVMRFIIEDRRTTKGDSFDADEDEERAARQVMEDSQDVGRRLCEEDEDVVESDEEDIEHVE